MPELPNINLDVVFALFTIVLTALASVWAVNKVIIIAKSH